jgi:hypothetical protein
MSIPTRIIAVSLAVGLSFTPQLVGAQGAIEQSCVGPAIIWPKSPEQGVIYMREEPREDGRLDRAGYLPSGTVVNLEEPSLQLLSRDHYCKFTVGRAVVGLVAKNTVERLSKLLDAPKLGKDEVVIISPANSTQPLAIYRNANLQSEKKLLSRSARTILLLSVKEWNSAIDMRESAKRADKDASEVGRDAFARVWYTDDIKSGARLKEGFINTYDDRSVSIEGTFRSFYISELSPLPYLGSESVAKKGEKNNSVKTIIKWGEWFRAYLEKYRIKLVNAIDDETGQCGIARTVSAEGNAGFGVEKGIFKFFAKAGAEASAKLEWIKPEDEADQFAIFGPPDGYHLSVAGIAECDNAKKFPAGLKLAEITIGDFGSDNKLKPILITRDDVFAKVGGLKDGAADVNKRRHESRGLTQMFNVPSQEPKKGFYSTYFDQLETYMSDKIFKYYPISDQEQFMLTLLIAETLSAWDRTENLLLQRRR